MPHATNAYPFEWKILEFARSLSARAAGGDGQHGFLLTPTAQGAMQTLRLDCPDGSWRPLAEALDRVETAYLLYDPFEPDEYTFLRWQRIERATMEALVGCAFEETDFHPAAWPHVKQPRDGLPTLQFPACWEVMF
ncbi:MAG: hypothetical protein JSR26_08860 [Proteobacteria bacterium]|nr:hypothetical protein [Pseudomonadota bacterium]